MRSFFWLASLLPMSLRACWPQSLSAWHSLPRGWRQRTAWSRTWKLLKPLAQHPPFALTRQEPWHRTEWLLPTCGLTTRSGRLIPLRTNLDALRSWGKLLAGRSYLGWQHSATVPSSKLVRRVCQSWRERSMAMHLRLLCWNVVSWLRRTLLTTERAGRRSARFHSTLQTSTRCPSIGRARKVMMTWTSISLLWREHPRGSLTGVPPFWLTARRSQWTKTWKRHSTMLIWNWEAWESVYWDSAI